MITEKIKFNWELPPNELDFELTLEKLVNRVHNSLEVADFNTLLLYSRLVMTAMINLQMENNTFRRQAVSEFEVSKESPAW